ncbi:MAG TPA: hypothetical protein VHT24_11525 [Pseudacidobacterium sp.]|jgi:hypothetical protein|nr:hypothetical protein [Pseudacidobacterium sp.]
MSRSTHDFPHNPKILLFGLLGILAIYVAELVLVHKHDGSAIMFTQNEHPANPSQCIGVEINLQKGVGNASYLQAVFQSGAFLWSYK